MHGVTNRPKKETLNALISTFENTTEMIPLIYVQLAKKLEGTYITEA